MREQFGVDIVPGAADPAADARVARGAVRIRAATRWTRVGRARAHVRRAGWAARITCRAIHATSRRAGPATTARRTTAEAVGRAESARALIGARAGLPVRLLRDTGRAAAVIPGYAITVARAARLAARRSREDEVVRARTAPRHARPRPVAGAGLSQCRTGARRAAARHAAGGIDAGARGVAARGSAGAAGR